jgi:hypothetical protein
VAKSEELNRERKRIATQYINEHVGTLATWCGGGRAAGYAEKYDPTTALGSRITIQMVRDAQAALEEIAGVFEQRGL